MFKFVVVCVFGGVMPGLALAGEKPVPCLAEAVNTHQVLVTGEYGGKPFAFTITSESPARPGKTPPPEKTADTACPLTS